MITTSIINENEGSPVPDDRDANKINGEKSAEDESSEVVEDNTGMDMGTKFKEDTEQDLDDLIHSRGTLNKNEIPPPEEA